MRLHWLPRISLSCCLNRLGWTNPSVLLYLSSWASLDANSLQVLRECSSGQTWAIRFFFLSLRPIRPYVCLVPFQIASPGFYFPQLIPKPGPSILPPQPDLRPPSRPENIVWTGGVEKCRCHGMSSHCDPITGVCESCTGNTMGPDCGQCAVGYMGDPTQGVPCVKCQCPTEQTEYVRSVLFISVLWPISVF